MPFSVTHLLFPKLSYINSIYALADQRKALLNTWKRWLEFNYKIKVNILVNQGSWQKGLIKYANQQKADIIALMKPVLESRTNYFLKTPYEFVLAKSNCQIMTFFSEDEHIGIWKNIVIPVTGFNPEQRIKTILDIASRYKIKLHLVTIGIKSDFPENENLPYITAAIKMINLSGNIQVQCSCISKTKNPVISFINYTRTVNEDILMTNKKGKETGHSVLLSPIINPSYGF